MEKKNRSVTLSLRNMVRQHYVHITTVLYSSIMRSYPLKLQISSLVHGEFLENAKEKISVDILHLSRLRILLIPEKPLKCATQTQATTLRNMLVATLCYLKFYERMSLSRSTFRLKTLLSVRSMFLVRKYSKISTEEITQEILQLLEEKKNQSSSLIFHYPKMFVLPSSASVSDLVLFLMLQNWTLTRMLLINKENGKNT